MNYDHWRKARKVCVVGAGTMGSGIAAHLANIGFEVTLLDRTMENAEESFERARLARPPHFYTGESAESIRLGSIEADLGWVSEADWVCEAIIENLDAKKALFAKLEPLLSPTCMVSTNTSGLQVSLLSDGLGESFRTRFMGTHFFNPPRYLKLLELIPTADADPKAVKSMTKFLEESAARRVIVAKDTPGFIANRFGMWAMYHAIHTTERLHLAVEEADSITGPFLGRPRTASFRLNDLVGLDVMSAIASNLFDRCSDDPFRSNLQAPRSLKTLIEKGRLGDKSGQGYYKKEGKELVALDLSTMAYRMKRDIEYPSLKEISGLPLGQRIGRALEFKDEVGEFLRNHLVPVLRYAAYLKERISHSVQDFDRVMMWGFNWEMGPFAMMDAIGHDKLGIEEGAFYEDGKMRSYKGTLVSIPTEPHYRPLKDYPVVDQQASYNLRDLGDGVTAICISTKMGTITPQLVESLHNLLDSGALKRFVLASEARVFSAGYDLQFFADHIANEDFAAIEEAIKRLQSLANKISQFPSVSAVFGHCLGAGFELASRCSILVANAEAQIGLPEAKVGLVPGGAGTAVMRVRNQHLGAKGLAEIALRMVLGTVSGNADEARHLGFLRKTDVTSYHPDRLIWDAKQLVQDVAPRSEEALVPAEGPLSGMIDTLMAQRKAKGEITDHDEQIGLKIKTVFGRSTSFDDAVERERQVFIDLCRRALTLTRIRHMLETGKSLRN